MRTARLIKAILRKPDEGGNLGAQAASATDPEPKNEPRQDAHTSAETDLLDREKEE